MPELILSLNGFIKNGCYRKFLSPKRSNDSPNPKKDDNIENQNQNCEKMRRNMRLDIDLRRDRNFDTNAGNEDKFRYILERMDRQELKLENILKKL